MYKKLKSEQILNAHREEFINRIYYNTLERAWYMNNLGVVINATFFFLFDYLSYIHGAWTDNDSYKYIFIWRLFAFSGFFIFAIIYKIDRPKTYELIEKKHRIIASAFVTFMVTIGTWLSISNKLIVDDLSMYGLFLFGVAVIFHLPNTYRKYLYVISFIVLFIFIFRIGCKTEVLASLVVNALSVVIVVFVIENFTFKHEIRSFINMKLIEHERAISEKLLLNILPDEIAQQLRYENKMIADGFTEASVLFADIVGFTAFSAKMKPEKVVIMLNSIFSSFDILVEKYHVEKIKTIGDAYMVASGLPKPDKMHAYSIAELAIEMQNVITQYNSEKGASLDLRIGINSGPVVAGVIGTKKFIYDLWGDTVNIASRMESHGISYCKFFCVHL